MTNNPGSTIRCPQCQQALAVRPEHAGKRMACPRCKTAVAVPQVKTAESSTPVSEAVVESAPVTSSASPWPPSNPSPSVTEPPPMAVPVAPAASTLRPMGQGNAAGDDYGLDAASLFNSSKPSWEAIEPKRPEVDARQLAADRIIAQAKADGQKQLERKDSSNDGGWGGAMHAIWVVVVVIGVILQIMRLNMKFSQSQQPRYTPHPTYQPYDR